MDESSLTKIRLLADNRDRLWEELLCTLGRKSNKLYGKAIIVEQIDRLHIKKTGLLANLTNS